MRYFAAPRLLQNVTRQRLRSNVRNLDNPRLNIKNDLYNFFLAIKNSQIFSLQKISFHANKKCYTIPEKWENIEKV